MAMAAGAPVIKFGQFIGQATVAIPAGDHVHTHNCVFANPEKDYAIGADLAAAQRAIPRNGGPCNNAQSRHFEVRVR